MGNAGIRASGSKEVTIANIEITGFDVGIGALHMHNLVIKQVDINNCITGTSLESCWDSEIKGINITSQLYSFRLTNLFVAIIRANNANS